MNSTDQHTREFIQTGIELPFVLFHVSVCACIMRQIRVRNGTFCSAFFKFYVLQSVSDIVTYLTYLFGLRIIDLLPAFMRRNPWYDILLAIIQYFECLTYSLHVAIAANRFIVIAKPATRPSFTKLRVVLLCTLPPLPLGISALLMPDCAVTDDKEECLRVAYTLTFVGFALYSGATSIATVSLDGRTFWSFRALNNARKLQGREDFYLLVYSMLQFTFIFAQSVMYSIITVGLWLREGELVDAVYPFTWYNMSLLSLTPPICLMVMSKKLRRAYVELYFRCKTDASTVAAIRSCASSGIEGSIMRNPMTRISH